MFGTPAGRRQLQDSARFGRLVVAVLRRGHLFESLDAVKEELAHSAKMLVPNGFSGQIPFLSLGSDVGRRVKVHEGSSKVSGDFVVEDVDVEGSTYRRLVFLENQFLVQSEAKLKTVKKKSKTKQIMDFGHVSVYHSFMCVSLPPITTKVAVLGLGGGSLCMFLKKCYENLKIVAVDLDPKMLEIAKDHFGLQVDDNLEVQIKDGLDFLKHEVEGGKQQYDAIMFDMDSKDRSLGLSCPPAQFLHEDVFCDVDKLLTNDGHFILNLVCRDTNLHESIIEKLKKHFKHLATVKLYEEVNEIIFATNSKSYTMESLEISAKHLNTTARQKNLVNIRCVDLKDFLQSVNIVS